MLSLAAIIFFTVLSVATSTEVRQCKVRDTDLWKTEVDIASCEAPPCVLKSGVTLPITVKFTPEKDMETVKSFVMFMLKGYPKVFDEMSGINMCNKIYTEDGTQAGCPLKAGTTYVYKDEFQLNRKYPKIRGFLQWNLMDDNKRSACFNLKVTIK